MLNTCFPSRTVESGDIPGTCLCDKPPTPVKTVDSKSLMSFLIDSISYPSLLFAGGISAYPMTPGRMNSRKLIPGFLPISPWVPFPYADCALHPFMVGKTSAVRTEGLAAGSWESSQ